MFSQHHLYNCTIVSKSPIYCKHTDTKIVVLVYLKGTAEVHGNGVNGIKQFILQQKIEIYK